MNRGRIFFLCPDYDKPVGGIKELYRHVDILNRNGFSAFILHTRKGFRCGWFANDTRIAYKSDLKGIEKTAAIIAVKEFLFGPVFNPFYLIKCAVKFLLKSDYRHERLDGLKRYLSDSVIAPFRYRDANLEGSDYLVIPEIYGPGIADIERGIRKIIFNQNAHLTFIKYSLDRNVMAAPYHEPEVSAAAVVSEHSYEYLRYAFPGLYLARFFIGIDPGVFRYNAVKKKQIAFMPRKLPEEVEGVINILKFRGALEDFELVPIGDRNELETAAILRESLIFLSFSVREGCPLPPMEAMACGCVVIGYDGYGGREYFKEEFCYPVPSGDVLSFARTVEAVIREYEANKDGILQKGKKASDFIYKTYSPEREEASIVNFWKERFVGRS